MPARSAANTLDLVGTSNRHADLAGLARPPVMTSTPSIRIVGDGYAPSRSRTRTASPSRSKHSCSTARAAAAFGQSGVSSSSTCTTTYPDRDREDHQLGRPRRRLPTVDRVSVHHAAVRTSPGEMQQHLPLGQSEPELLRPPNEPHSLHRLERVDPTCPRDRTGRDNNPRRS
jgi:hypothetical protein